MSHLLVAIQVIPCHAIPNLYAFFDSRDINDDVGTGAHGTILDTIVHSKI